jgi:RimJ/RimL family protein N-acetyltransferase
LVLREFEARDAKALYALNSDPEVLRYTGDDPFPNVNASADFIAAYDHYRKHGFGRWAVVARDNDAFMGFCGLRRSPVDGSVDLGFRLFRKYWAQGFATEAARAALQGGFDHFRLEEITGRAMRENLPSITVLQKLGMRFSAVTEERGLIWLVYVISKDRFHEAH